MKTSNFARFNPNRITVQSSAYARDEANSLLVDHEIRSGNIPKLENYFGKFQERRADHANLTIFHDALTR